ncbi:hypothetical protein PHLCEN_2v2319 [Hermanssonia centrifuga]|uniref:Uncharacterized protein n=1 Tax=Hermanssonia centrifuga TaxID=98765 RepID=A0A2R6RPF8_9APHY|nr:hypothetical protein PHLCEN_2v2319 [Hermanssonia centrifuga]
MAMPNVSTNTCESFIETRSSVLATEIKEIKNLATTSCQTTQQARRGGKAETVAGTLESQMDRVSSKVRDADKSELLRRNEEENESDKFKSREPPRNVTALRLPTGSRLPSHCPCRRTVSTRPSPLSHLKNLERYDCSIAGIAIVATTVATVLVIARGVERH